MRQPFTASRATAFEIFRPGTARVLARGGDDAANRFDAARIDIGDAAPFVAAWRDLAVRSAEANPFFHPEFLLPAARALAPGDIELVVVGEAGSGRLMGLAPVRRGRAGFGLSGNSRSVWSHSYGPLGVPLIDREALDPVAATLLAALAPGAVAVLPDLPLDGPVAGALLRAVARAGGTPVIVDHHDRAALDCGLAATAFRRTALSQRWRKNVSRSERRLAELGAVDLVRVDAADAVPMAFETFRALEASGWKGRRGTALVSRPPTRQFSRDAIVGLAEAGKVSIWALRLDEAPIAMTVVLHDGGDVFTWKTAYDEAFAAFSPGLLLTVMLTEGLLEDDTALRIDSLANANHPMVDHLWHGRKRIGTVVLPAGARQARARLAAAEIRAHRMLRRYAAGAMTRLRRR